MPWFLGILILVTDQWTKHAAQTYCHESGECRSAIRFRVVRHYQPAYQSGASRASLVILWIAALLCAHVLAGKGIFFSGARAQAGLGIAFGGAAGNLIDGLFRRHVIDFIHVGWWPTFNLADAAIVAGLAAAILL